MQSNPESLLINEIQLLLAEKRTYFALLRTGAAVATLPFSVIVFLIATYGYHHLFDSNVFAGIVIGGLLLTSILGISLVERAIQKVRHINRLIKRIRGENKRLAEIVI